MIAKAKKECTVKLLKVFLTHAKVFPKIRDFGDRPR
jgi:hypothetical protein